MHRWLLGLLLALAFTLPAQAEATCHPLADRSDAAGDVTLLGSPVPPADPPQAIDVLQVRMWINDDVAHYEATFMAAPEFGSATFTYRYWLGFGIDAGGAREYLDVRIAATATYDEGTLISSNSDGNRDLATVPIAWNGTTLSFSFPIQLLREVYGPLDLGAPEVQADGRSLTTLVQGAPVGAVYIDYFFSDGFETLCHNQAEPLASAPEMSSPGKDAPMLGGLGVMVLLLIALMARRQAY